MPRMAGTALINTVTCKSTGQRCSAAQQWCRGVKGRCVLGLQKAPHGFKAKVSDWGMLRELDTRGFASQQKYPCLSHLAPEVLLRGTMSKVALLPPHTQPCFEAPGVCWT